MAGRAPGARYKGEIRFRGIRRGKSKNAKRNLSLTARANAMLKARKAVGQSAWVFPGKTAEAAILGSSLSHQRDDVRGSVKARRKTS